MNFFNLMLDPPTIIAFTGLLSVLGNIILTLDARKRSMRNAETLTNVIVPKVTELKDLTSGQADKLNAVSKALGHAEGLAEGKSDAPPKT